MRGEQAIFNLEIKKKSGLSINPDIHHSKVFSSGQKFIIYLWKMFKFDAAYYKITFDYFSGLQPFKNKN